MNLKLYSITLVQKGGFLFILGSNVIVYYFMISEKTALLSRK
jgi:hypothetical protein